MRTFTAILLFLIIATAAAQDGYYFLSTHNFNQYWKKYNADRSDSSVCNFEFKWTAFRGNHPLIPVLNKEAATLVCIPFNDSCPGDSITESWLDRQSIYLKNEWQKDIKSASDKMVNYEFYADLSVLENQAFISLVVSIDIYTGGAHPSNYSRYAVIDRHEQKPVKSWASLFKDSAAMLRLGEIAFRDAYDLTDSAELDKSWFNGQTFFLPHNFYFDSAAMHFVYSPGEIAPPSYGPAILSFPFEKIDALARVRLH